MTKKLVWRLGKLPTVDELLRLVNDKLITQEEAKEILFKESDIDERDKESLEGEIKFLKQLVEKLSDNNRNVIIEKIKYIEKPYYSFEWYNPYKDWIYCTTSSSGTINSLGMVTNCNFSSIQ